MALVYIEQLEDLEVEQMQTTHEKEVEILNEIDRLATTYQIQKKGLEELEKKLDEYVLHVRKHFSDEEDLMKKYDFPSYEMHKMAHDMFLADLDLALKQWKNYGDIQKIINFVRKVPEWLFMHVNTVDAPTSKYIYEKINS